MELWCLPTTVMQHAQQSGLLHQASECSTAVALFRPQKRFPHMLDILACPRWLLSGSEAQGLLWSISIVRAQAQAEG